VRDALTQSTVPGPGRFSPFARFLALPLRKAVKATFTNYKFLEVAFTA
jgi:hypothetical protein